MRFLSALAFLGLLSWCQAQDAAKPNIIFILADDLGWSDTTLNGTTKFFETPNLERLAARGMTFSNAYAACPVCSPTRASILTGNYPARIGITTPSCHEAEVRLEPQLTPRGSPTQKSLQASSATRLKQAYVTLAEVLKGGGYATGHFGKWHLGLEPYDPLHQGFDVDVPHWPGPGPVGYIAPWKSDAFKLPTKYGEHVEDLMAHEAIKFIRNNRDKPFYLNYWAFSVHSPWGAKPELIEKYRKKSDPKSLQREPVYAAMVESLDDAVGRLTDTLDELKIADRTIIVFFSDNGGVNWFEPKMKEQNGMNFAPTTNAPLRGGKGTLYEGGVREPCVVVWPGKAKPGTKTEALLNSVDFYPTLLEMAGINTEAKIDGISQVAVLLGTGKPRDAVYNYYPHYSPPGHVQKNIPAASVRSGDWKLIRFFNDGPDQGDRFELYSLRDDPGETRNLAKDQAPKVQELDALLSAHLREVNALVPGPNPFYNPQVPDIEPGKESTLVKRDGVLVMNAKSAPSLLLKDIPSGKGPFTIGLRMRSNGKGAGRVFWTTAPKEPINKERSVNVDIKHDDTWRNYAIKLPVEKAVQSLRIDPGVGPGDFRIEFIRLRGSDDKLVRDWSFSGDDYQPPPEAARKPDVPQGKVFQYKFENSRIFPGTSRNVTVYVPAQYKGDKAACVYVGLDGLGFGAPQVFDTLIHSGEMPVTIGIGVSPGSVATENPRFNRSYEFDGLNDNLARFILEELMPDLEQRKTPDGLPILLSKDPNDRCTGGGSTGAIAAFTLAWERPDAFRRVFSAIGTYVGMRGGDRYPVLVRKTEPKPIRIFMQDGESDQWMGGPEVGDWWMSNQTLERALTFSGYQVKHEWGTGKHSGKHATSLFPDAMRWLWKDWPAEVTSGISDNKVLQTILQPGSGWEPVKDEMPETAKEGQSIKTHDGRTYKTEPATGEVWMVKGDQKTLLDKGLRRPTGIAISPDGLWLAVLESESHWGYSYQVKADGTVADKQKYYWFHVPDWAEDSGAGSAAMDVLGQMYVATRMGVEVFDRNGRVRAILPLPDGAQATSLRFEENTLFVGGGGKVWKRVLKVKGVPSEQPPIKLPPWGAG